MHRREFLGFAPVMGMLSRAAVPAVLRAAAPSLAPIPESHFPSRLHQFVWRNWEIANVDRMAMTVHTTPERLLELGAAMGLPANQPLSDDQLRRLYITVIRQNWHLLPNDQIQALLGWDKEHFEFILKEDDFLSIKLGAKPACERLVYRPPTEQEQRAAVHIREEVRSLFGDVWKESGEPLFQFVSDLSDPRYTHLREPDSQAGSDEIDFSSGWAVEAADDQIVEVAAERLRRYLREALGARLHGAKDRGVIRLALEGTTGESVRFRVEAERTQVRLVSPTPEGVLRAVYWLQDQMEARGGPFIRAGTFEREETWDPRFVYPFFALSGDPLFESQVDPLPDAYLEKLARVGINGVWMHAPLRTLAPSTDFPEFGEGWETRLRNLNSLVERAARYGIRIYLYVNEPRAMKGAFFQRHPDVRGSSSRDTWAMCTSVPKVREWIAGSLEHVAREVPGIGGFFTISMSENHTNCFSHGGAWGTGAPNAGDCPRCPKRKSWDVVAELLNAMRDGVRRSNATAQILHWDWGWGDALATELIPRLSKDVFLLSISEWETPLDRGFPTRVGEYSISVVGPGPRAGRNWEHAREAGLKAAAKVQFNNTWEIAAVPYIPVPQLILEHCENLSRRQLAALMASWTCGGYPSPNLAVAQAYYWTPRASQKEILLQVAATRCGAAGADRLVEAWSRYSRAFQEFPYGVHMYLIPTHHGPANLLRLDEVEHRPGMLLFPHDAWRVWVGDYPPEIVQRQFTKMAALWAEGLPLLEGVLAQTPATRRKAVELDLAVARTCWRHFRSVANQVEFYRLRERLKESGRGAVITRMQEIARDEMKLAREQFVTSRRHSVIAYEASCHYFYRPLDLAEKTLNANRVIAELDRRRKEV